MWCHLWGTTIICKVTKLSQSFYENHMWVCGLREYLAPLERWALYWCNLGVLVFHPQNHFIGHLSRRQHGGKYGTLEVRELSLTSRYVSVAFLDLPSLGTVCLLHQEICVQKIEQNHLCVYKVSGSELVFIKYLVNLAQQVNVSWPTSKKANIYWIFNKFHLLWWTFYTHELLRSSKQTNKHPVK